MTHVSVARPPRFAERVLAWALGDRRVAGMILGDLAEEHHAIEARVGARSARRWYWGQAIPIGTRYLWLDFTNACRTALADARSQRGDGLMSELLRDLRVALRTPVRHPGFAAIVVLTLGVGLASNATVFALLDSLVLRPFPVREIDRLVGVFGVSPQQGAFSDRSNVSPADLLDWQRESKVAEDLVAMTWWDATVTGTQEPERIQAFRVSPAFFSMLGIDPIRGRAFRREETETGRDRVAVVGHGLWQRRFGADPSLLGRTIQLDGLPYEVVGIAPPRFDYPFGSEMWAPLSFTADEAQIRGGRYLRVIGKLRQGRTPEELQAELATVARRLQTEHPDTNRGWSVNVMTLSKAVVDIGVGPILTVWQTSALLVLLMACVNVASLLLVRGMSREKELALRAAIGAGRFRIARQLLMESFVLALAGAALAVPLAWAALRAHQAAMPPEIARFVRGWDQLDVDVRLVVALGLFAAVATLMFGLLPALRASRVTLTEVLKEGGRGTAGGTKSRLRHAMVVVEVALSLTLLVAAALSVQSARWVLNRDDGYEPTGVMTMTVTLPESRYEDDDRRRVFFEQLVERIRPAAGVEGVALTNILPSGGNNWSQSFEVEGRPPRDRVSRPSADYRVITPDYFDVLRVILVAGRRFDTRDRESTQHVAIVSRLMAERFWPGEDPLGRRLCVNCGDKEERWLTVVGVAADVRHDWFLNRLEPTFYVPLAQSTPREMAIMMRTTGDPAALAAVGRAAVRAGDPDQPVDEIRTLRELRSGQAIGLRFAAAVMGAFGMIGLLLAGVGVYGVMAFAVSQRTHEIGVRVALGASRRDILASAIGRGLWLTAIGLILGLAGAYALGRFMESMMFGAVRLDVLTFVIFPLVLAGVALAACVVPARRALRVDPIVALRAQ